MKSFVRYVAGWGLMVTVAASFAQAPNQYAFEDGDGCVRFSIDCRYRFKNGTPLQGLDVEAQAQSGVTYAIEDATLHPDNCYLFRGTLHVFAADIQAPIPRVQTYPFDLSLWALPLENAVGVKKAVGPYQMRFSVRAQRDHHDIRDFYLSISLWDVTDLLSQGEGADAAQKILDFPPIYIGSSEATCD